jgi:hypothetical protein
MTIQEFTDEQIKDLLIEAYRAERNIPVLEQELARRQKPKVEPKEEENVVPK